MKTGTNPTAKVTGAATVTWMCASNAVQIFNGTDKASIFEAFLVKGYICILVFFLLWSPDNLILGLRSGLQHWVPPSPRV